MLRFFLRSVVLGALSASTLVSGATLAASEGSRVDPRLRAAVASIASSRDAAGSSGGNRSAEVARSGVAAIKASPAPCRDASGRPLCRLELSTEDAARRFATEIESGADGLALEARTRKIVWAWASPAGLGALDGARDLVYAALPFTSIPTRLSEGVADMRADRFQSLGYRGRGVRVGVIDIGFQGYGAMLGGELPASVHVRSFYGGANGDGDITGGGENHGSACAEVIHDVAPDAELYLANVSNDLDLQRAVDWMVEEGVEVISHSLAWFVGGGDGRGPISTIVAQAESEGIVWVTAAGNFANAHWGGLARDVDSDGRIELDEAGDETINFTGLPLSTDLSFLLLWNRWPSSADLSFAIDLRASDGALLASSEGEFADFGYAFRALDYTTAPGGLAPELSIRRVKGNADGVSLQLFRVDGGGVTPLPEHRVLRGSLAIPADSPAAISVGAFGHRDEADAATLESFSSAGPTADGRMKPEILGPDNIRENSVYGSSGGFRGTSAACPHVAGAVALLLSASIEGGLYDARLSPASIRRLLQNEALPLIAGTRIAEAEGWGRARLVLDRPTATTTAVRLSLKEQTEETITFALSSDHRLAPTSLRLFDVSGRQLAQLAPRAIEERTIDFALGREWKAARGRYWALEPSSGASVSFYWPGSR